MTTKQRLIGAGWSNAAAQIDAEILDTAAASECQCDSGRACHLLGDSRCPASVTYQLASPRTNRHPDNTQS